MIFGASTPSYDAELEPDQTFPVDNLTEKEILEASKEYTGTIQQTPPMYSALKVDGEALYKKARRGENVEVKSREVTIHEFDLTDFDLPTVSFKVRCSKGTYIRSLAHDMGKSLNNGAYLGSLCRTRSGNFKLEDAWELEDFINFASEYRLNNADS